MASEWVKCTTDSKEPMYVNVSLATEMVPTDGGTFMFFGEKRVFVKEDAEQILTRRHRQ